MSQSLGEVQHEYELAYNYKISRKLPVVIKAKLINFKKFTQNLEKPFSPIFSEVMAQTAMYAISQIQDAVFGFYQNDEIVIILKNDKDIDYQPWLGNNIQSIVSEISSFLTNGFIKSLDIFGEELEVIGDAVFRANTFSLPSIKECVNYIIYRQDSCMKNAINKSCSFELEKQFGAEKMSRLFKNSSYDTKVEMLQRFCGLDFYESYPPKLIYGISLYKVPRIIQNNDMVSVTRNRWFIDDDVPNFIDDKEFVSAIIANGADIFRAEDIIN